MMHLSAVQDKKIRSFVKKLISQVLIERMKLAKEGLTRDRIDRIQIYNWTKYFYDYVIQAEKSD